MKVEEKNDNSGTTVTIIIITAVVVNKAKQTIEEI